MQLPQLPVQIASDLVLRFAESKDIENLAQFNQKIHSSHEGDTRLASWTKDLLEGKNPNVSRSDCTIVEDPQNGKIVSTMLMIPQTWTYEGIPFLVGRPELVATDPAYRNRGLVRAQFDVLHAYSESRGELVQAITGIPYYYRQFGYEMAVDLDVQRKGYAPQQVPLLKENEQEPYLFRAAQEADLPQFMTWINLANQRYLLACERDLQFWQYELKGHREDSVNRYDLITITDREGEPVGLLVTPHFLWDSGFFATVYELKPGISWHDVTPSVLRYLWETGQKARSYNQKSCDAIGFALGADHPAYAAVGKRMSDINNPYAWYLRVPDLPAFINKIAPALERRLADSAFIGLTREIEIGFYTNGLKIHFENGRFVSAENWQPPDWEKVNAAFPDKTFLQLIFGHRTISELRYAFTDCWTKDRHHASLLNTLFPKKASNIWPLG